MSNSVQYSVKLTGSQNAREHWRTRAKRVKSERSQAEILCRSRLERPQAWPVVVRLTRIGPRKLDSDNVSGACKATRDGVADWLGVDDGDEARISWVYAQELGQYGVRIELLRSELPRGASWDCTCVAKGRTDRGDVERCRRCSFRRAPVVEAETDGADPADVETWDEVLP